ncbi:unnamed protein product [Camellia sinensis]
MAVQFKGVPILKQLHLEEQLLRISSDNWCIINDGTNAPTVVMGLSGKPCELLELGSVLQDQVPVIRRFTGGGTVIVDPGTTFVTLICNRDDVPGVQPYPRSIMHWSGLLYNKVFEGIGDFHLRENAARSHKEFVCRMKEYMPRSVFIDETVKAIGNHFSVNRVDLDVDAAAYDAGFNHSSRLLMKQELEEALSSS